MLSTEASDSYWCLLGARQTGVCLVIEFENTRNHRKKVSKKAVVVKPVKCASCGAEPEKLRSCSICKKVGYCVLREWLRRVSRTMESSNVRARVL